MILDENHLFSTNCENYGLCLQTRDNLVTVDSLDTQFEFGLNKEMCILFCSSFEQNSKEHICTDSWNQPE